MPPRSARDELIRSLLPSVRKIAIVVVRRHPARDALAEDIYSAGLEGLVRGAAAFDPSLVKSSPKSYIERRIYGAMLDYLRGEDTVTRSERSRARETGIDAPTRYVVSLEDPVRKRLTDVDVLDGDVTWLDTLQSNAPSPADEAELRDTLATVERAARTLPARTQEVLRLRYSEELDMVVIGSMVGVSEARICQLLRGAHAAIREALAA